MADKEKYDHIHILVNREKESDVLDFFNIQSNKSASIKILIRDFMKKFGNVDVISISSLPKE
jgi:hypothetical protein